VFAVRSKREAGVLRGKGIPALIRRVAIITLGWHLAACSMQPRSDVAVTVGTGQPRTEMAKHYAALYLPYAMIAAAAYSDPSVLDARQNCPDVAKLGVRSLSKDERDFAFHRLVRGWVIDLRRHGWECRYGRVGSLPCPMRLPNCVADSGLEFHVWRRMDAVGCREVVVAFRGTDRNDLGDWRANFRWFHRLAPKFDQYDQVRTNIGAILKRADSHGCANAAIASTGHSLGGGLAQQAAYASGARIGFVYAFDPSPVTGFFDVSAMVREKSVTGLGIDRTYEAGEILSIPRHIIEGEFMPAACDPRVRHIRFNLLDGNPIAQHSIGDLTENMRLVAREPGADRRLAAGYIAARDCRRQAGPSS
jgi:hypothetical protein